jgi:hypothetical protein
MVILSNAVSHSHAPRPFIELVSLPDEIIFGFSLLKEEIKLLTIKLKIRYKQYNF